MNNNDNDEHSLLLMALRTVIQLAQRHDMTQDEKARIVSLVELFVEYDLEIDTDEKANILRTLKEISDNEPLELPRSSVAQACEAEQFDDWDRRNDGAERFES